MKILRIRNQSNQATKTNGLIVRFCRYASFACLIGFGCSVPTVGFSQDSSLFDASLFNEAERMLDVNSVELRIQLTRGLRVFLPEQEQFIDRVLVEVNNRRISRSMVNVIFIWAQRRNPKVPFPYCEFVMRELAKQRGVAL